MARRQHITLALALTVLTFLGLTYLMSVGSEDGYLIGSSKGASTSKLGDLDLSITEGILKGGSIAPKLENATAKAELGRATWKFLHTTMARFPEEPTADQSLALKTFITLFSHLYPCGDCAAHFRTLLEKYPPQTSSRNAAAGWACFVHNEVNKRLHKEEFDCSKIGDFYDCGCGEEGKSKGGGKKSAQKEEDAEDLKGRESVSLEKEGLAGGG